MNKYFVKYVIKQYFPLRYGYIIADFHSGRSILDLGYDSKLANRICELTYYGASLDEARKKAIEEGAGEYQYPKT